MKNYQMICSAGFRFNLPLAILMTLLQRTPVVCVAVTAGEWLASSPSSAVLKAAFAVVGSLGAVHSLAGATTLSATTVSPASATVGTAKTIAFSVLGTQSPASSWTIGGSVPPGMSFKGGATIGIVNITSGFRTMSGTPTLAGSYLLSLKAWENTGGKGNVSPTFSYTINVSGAVVTAPSIVTQPVSQTATVGGGVTFSSAASGTPTPTYQWQKNGATIVGETGASLVLSNVQTGAAGGYAVVATNTVGTATSNAATLTVNFASVAPAITTQPSNQTATVGQTITFTFVASGTPAPTYQWQKNGAAIAGETGASLVLSNVQTGAAGSYSVVATNSAGTATSNAATLTVNVASAAPAIATQPSSQTMTVGQVVTFTVVATGTPTPTYQWQKNGAALAGETGASLVLTNVQTGAAGTYAVVATNTAGTVASSAATLTVNSASSAPTITTQPSSQTTAVGQTVIFSVVATGSPTPTYQWQKNGVGISGATGATFTVTGAQLSDAGSYAVSATNSAGAATSAPITLTVTVGAGPAPAITLQPPGSLNLIASQSLALNVGATGSSLSYQWRRVNGTGVTSIPGATGPTLTIKPVGSVDAGTYYCNVSNGAGSADSAPVAVAVTTASTNPGRLINLSVLTGISTTGDSFSLGYVVSGASTANSKPLVIRAAGPSLGALGVPGTLSDPKMELFAGSVKTEENDNWGGLSTISTAMSAVGAFPYSNAATLDSAVASSVTSRDNSVKISAGAGAPDATGSVIAEVYDATPSNAFDATRTPRLINLSVLKNVGSGLTMGFVIGGSTGKTMLVRAIGPTLGTAFGLGGVMSDPKIELFDSAGKSLAINDNWGGTPALAGAFGDTGAFVLPAGSGDAALLITLAPGNYTAQVTVATGSTGLALVEVYDVP